MASTSREHADLLRTADQHALLLAFLSYTETITDGCWTWKGEITKKGYGRLYWKGKKIRAQRVAYFLWNGEVPE